MAVATEPAHVPKDILMPTNMQEKAMERSFKDSIGEGSEFLFRVFAHIHKG
jgi:hypothetical protein